jgi:hypothetical protein
MVLQLLFQNRLLLLMQPLLPPLVNDRLALENDPHVGKSEQEN